MSGDEAPIDFHFAPALSELTLVTRDRPMLFASIAGALAAWGMNIVTADAFSNAHGIVVDTFRFTDTFRTLELNESERGRFVASIAGVLSGEVLVGDLLAARRRAPRPIRPKSELPPASISTPTPQARAPSCKSSRRIPPACCARFRLPWPSSA